MSNPLTSKLSSLFTRLNIKIREKSYHDLPYLYQKKGADSLMVVFSAFTGDKRRYNYIKSFSTLKCDKLFILDPWGYRGSYNLYNNGDDYPMRTTIALIRQVMTKGKYKHLYTAGSSKGGTCALFFGMELGADAIFTGACQYNLGTYLWREEFRKIFYSMMGEDAGMDEVSLFNSIIKNKLRENSGTQTEVHVVYSKKELTYERQIIDLLRDLKQLGIPYKDVESDFERHEDVSTPFVKYVKDFFN